VFFTTDLFSGLVWSGLVFSSEYKQETKSLHHWISLSLSLSLSPCLSSREKKIQNKTLVQSIPFKYFGTEQNLQDDGSLLSLLLRKISSGFPDLLQHDKHFRVFHTNFARGPASSRNLESTAYHQHIY
jgi:hypothetical protein